MGSSAGNSAGPAIGWLGRRLTRPGRLVGDGTARSMCVDGRSPSILALHGFGATPAEMELVLEVAGELGLCASAPLLPGHGTRPEDLGRTTFGAWLDAARTELLRLGGRGPVIVTGQSLGTLLGLELQHAYPELVLGLVLLANSLWLRFPHPAVTLGLLAQLPLPRWLLSPIGAADLLDPEARSSQLSYDRKPLAAAAEVWRRGRRDRRLLSEVHCPTLLVHGRHDHVCSPSNLRRVGRRLGTQDVRQVMLSNSAHIVTRDRDRSILRAELLTFFERLGFLARSRADRQVGLL